MTAQRDQTPDWVRRALPCLFVIHGRPVVQKNGKQIVRVGGRVALISGTNVRRWRRDAVRALRQSWGGLPPIPAGVELSLAIVSYQGRGQRSDASNLYEAPQDALEAAGVIANDYWVRTHDGSDRRRDYDNPRVELTLSLYCP